MSYVKQKKESCDVFNWTDNYLSNITEEIYSLKQSQHQISLRKRNQSTIFNLNTKDEQKKISKEPNKNFIKSKIFDQNCNEDNSTKGIKINNKFNNNSTDIKNLTILGGLRKVKSDNDFLGKFKEGKVNEVKIRSNVANITSVDNPLNASKEKPAKTKMINGNKGHVKATSISLF